MVQIKGKLLDLLVNSSQQLTLGRVRQLWLWHVCSVVAHTALHEHRDKMCFMFILVWIYIYLQKMCVCVCVCVHSIKVFSSQSRSKPSSTVAAAVREPVPEWKESDERKEECSLQKRVQAEKHRSPVPPGSSPPLYLLPQLPNYSWGLSNKSRPLWD